jgi:hypothetical protein
VSETKRAAHQLEKDKQTLNDALENAKQLTDTQNYQTQHFRLKADFLHRYYSYVVSKENPAELKLFADVVCVLWKRSQEARLNIRPESIFVTPLSVRRGLDQAAKDELSRHGINHDAIAQQLRDIDAQLQRVSRAPRVGPFSSPEAERVRRETQSRELQIASELRSATPRKIVTFSDVPYEVPQPVADVVHMRADCAPGR